MSDWKQLTDAELEDYETRDSREEFLKASLIEARAALPQPDGAPREPTRDERLRDIHDRWMDDHVAPSRQAEIWPTFPRNPTQYQLYDRARADIGYLLRARPPEPGATDLSALIGDDAFACSFQTLGQYRSALLRALRAPSRLHGEPTFFDQRERAMIQGLVDRAVVAARSKRPLSGIVEEVTDALMALRRSAPERALDQAYQRRVDHNNEIIR
jgi:hypothetical protein